MSINLLHYQPSLPSKHYACHIQLDLKFGVKPASMGARSFLMIDRTKYFFPYSHNDNGNAFTGTE